MARLRVRRLRRHLSRQRRRRRPALTPAAVRAARSTERRSGGSAGTSGSGGGHGGAPSGAAIQIDAGARGGAIHPEIYGLAFATPATLTALNVPLNRWGGNAVTMFNWQLDSHNLGSDYFFENVANNANDATYGTASYVLELRQLRRRQQRRARGDADDRADDRLDAEGSRPQPPVHLRLPGVALRRRAERRPLRQELRQRHDVVGREDHARPDQRRGRRAAQLRGRLARAPDRQIWHDAGTGNGVRFYQLDNEMMLWDSTHRDVRANPVSYADVWNATLSYAPVIRQADPAATILGYTSWGVLDLFNSGLDSANSNLNDQKAHGGTPLAEWYLQQLAAYEAVDGTAPGRLPRPALLPAGRRPAAEHGVAVGPDLSRPVVDRQLARRAGAAVPAAE